MTTGRALADGLALADEDGGLEVGLVGQVTGRHDGVLLLPVGDEGVVGAEVVGLLVGALDVVGADDVGGCELGGGGGGAGAWSVRLAGTLAGGGKGSSGTPTRSRCITAAQVAVG